MDSGVSGATRVAVIGAGIVGASVAYELRKRGADVVLLDRGEPGSGCSAGNSGAVSPASVAPLAMPGLLASLPGMLMDRESPLYLPWSYLPTALPWLVRFLATAREKRVAAAAASLAALHVGAVARHQAMACELGVPELFLQRGHLHVYPDDTALAKDARGWRLREACGYAAERLDFEALRALEPNLGARYRVGMFLPDQATILNPLRYVQAIARGFGERGGRVQRAEVRAVRPAGAGWHVDTGDATTDVRAAHVVVAAGAWSRRLLDPLGLRFSLETQRGYHVRFEDAGGVVSRTVVLADRKIFLTPMEDGLRVGGTVEIGGLERPPDPRRAAVLERIARQMFPSLASQPGHHWMGHRPCMPDSLPVVGAAAGHPGLWLAIGHGHLGLTQSLPTADRLAGLILGASSGR